MAKENTEHAQTPETTEPTPASPTRGLIKAFVVVVVILLLEGGTVFVTMTLSGGPREVQGQGLTADLEAEQNKLVEVPVVREKFNNQLTGKTILYDTEVYVTVRHRDLKTFKQQLESMEAQVAVDIATVIRRAEPGHFMEPTLATLSRQIKMVLDERFGQTTGEDEEPMVCDVLIRKCIPFSADY